MEKYTYECHRPRPRRISRTSIFERNKISKMIELVFEYLLGMIELIVELYETRCNIFEQNSERL